MNKIFVNSLFIAITFAVVATSAVAQNPHAHDHGVEHDAKPLSESGKIDEQHGHSDDQHTVHNEQAHEEHIEDSHDEPEHDEHDEESGAVNLSQAQMKLAEIKSEVVIAQTQHRRIYAPAEIKANGYTTYVVSPRVDSVVMKRHISLGEHVHVNQPLLTLFSAVIAQEQADYLINFAEYKRINKLSSEVISEKYASDVKTRYEASMARLKAFGLTSKTIDGLTTQKNPPLGEYTLEAQQSGLVLSDEFQQGQRIGAGQPLIVLADESSLWVEASLSPNTHLDLTIGTEAELLVNDQLFTAQVTQETHTIDPITRTRTVRLLAKNSDHQLHSGMFGDVYFNEETKLPTIAVPESALMRGPDGDWIVFVEEHPQEFVATEVELGRLFGHSSQPLREIIGIESGQKIVTQGAFFIASEQAKGGFDPHNH